MFYLLNFHDHSFSGFAYVDALLAYAKALIAEGLDESDLEVVVAGEDDRYTLDDCCRRCKEE